MNYRLLLPLILLCTSFSSQAQERWFEIELLLFQRNVAFNDIKEDLATEDAGVDSSNSIPLLTAQCAAQQSCLHNQNPVLISSEQFDSAANNFQLLDNAQLQFSEQRQKLQDHAAFTPLLHLAWRMPVKSKNKSQAIHLFAGKNLASAMQQAKSVNTQAFNNSEDNGQQTAQLVTGSEENLANNNTQTAQLADKWGIDGNLNIYLEHYLFVDSQLTVRQLTTQQIKATKKPPLFEVVKSENNVEVIKPSTADEPEEEQLETVINETLFAQNRRLRSSEIHYFDHPLMGMIIQIRKIDNQEQTTQPESDQ